MHVGVIHTITDRAAWDRITGGLDLNGLPEGFVLHCTMTSDDVTKAICLWDAPSAAQLQSMLDDTFQAAARNDCFAADPERSIGVPAAMAAQA
jgi:hypothetical protein